MIIKIKIVVPVVIIFGILFINSGCHKLFCIPHHYNFKVTSTTIQPINDSIKVGDTLSFNSVFSSRMTNLNDNMQIDYSNADNMGDILGVGELVGKNIVNDAVKYFTFISKVGQIYTDSTIPSPGRVKQTLYDEQNGFYKLEFELVPKKPGIYAFSIADLPDVVRKCDRSIIQMQFSPTMDNHLHYLEDIYYGGNSIDPIDSTHSYCFKVY